MVDPVIIQIQTQGAARAKRQIEGAAQAADKAAVAKSRMKRATDDLTVAMTREASAARKATVERARTAAQSRGANGARQIIGGVGRGLGGAVGQARSALVEPVIIPIHTKGAARAKRQIDAAASSVDKLERSKGASRQASAGIVTATQREITAIKALAAQEARLARQRQRSGGGMASAAGRAMSSFGGSVGRFGAGVGAMGAGGIAGTLMIASAAIAIGTKAFTDHDARRVESARRAAEHQLQIEKITRDVRDKQRQVAAASFAANRTSYEQLTSRFGPDGIRMSQDIQSRGFEAGDATRALMMLERFKDDQKWVVLRISEVLSKLGAGTLSEVAGSFTAGGARMAVQDGQSAAERIFRERMGFAPNQAQQQQIAEGLEQAYTNRRVSGLGEITRTRELQGRVGSQEFGAGLDLGAVETVLRERLSVSMTPLASALLEQNRIIQTQIKLHEAQVKAQSKLAQAISEFTPIGDRSAAKQFNDYMSGIPMVTP